MYEFLCAFMYVYAYMCAIVCVWTCVYMHIEGAKARMRMTVCIHVCMYDVCILAHFVLKCNKEGYLSLDACMDVYMCVCIHLSNCVCMYVCRHVYGEFSSRYVNVCMYVCSFQQEQA